MVFKVFAIFDVKADLYNAPFTCAARGQAIRMFTDLVNDAKSTPGMHPGDFKLVLVGEFNDESGELRAVPLEGLGFGTEYLKREVVNGVFGEGAVRAGRSPGGGE